MPSETDQEAIDQMEHNPPLDGVVAPPKQDMWSAEGAEPPSEDDEHEDEFSEFEDQTRTGDEQEPPPSDDEAQQARYLADAPEWAVVPPRNSDFANATWLEANADVRAIVHSVFMFEEFKGLATLDYEVRWRRASKPLRKSRRGDEPIFGTAEVVPPRAIWEAEHQGCETFPRLWIDLHWQNFEDRREVAPHYVHGDEIRAWLHHALSGLDVRNERVYRQQPDVSVFTKTVERFKAYQRGIRGFRRAAMLIPDDDTEEE